MGTPRPGRVSGQVCSSCRHNARLTQRLRVEIMPSGGEHGSTISGSRVECLRLRSCWCRGGSKGRMVYLQSLVRPPSARHGQFGPLARGQAVSRRRCSRSQEAHGAPPAVLSRSVSGCLPAWLYSVVHSSESLYTLFSDKLKMVVTCTATIQAYVRCRCWISTSSATSLPSWNMAAFPVRQGRCIARRLP